MLRNFALPLVLAVFVVLPGSAAAQTGGDRPVCSPDVFTASNDATCEIWWNGLDINAVYRYGGQGVMINCDRGDRRRTFVCPRAKDVNFKMTVIKSVKKALGFKSTTISNGKATGPVYYNPGDGTGKQTFYFAGVRDQVLRRMKAKKVRSMTLTVSGSVTGVDGTVKKFSRTRSSWSFNGNCGGMGLKMQRHLMYGGTCYRH